MKRSNAGAWKSTTDEAARASSKGKGQDVATPAESSVARALIDTNVALDWLLDRKPWSDAAQPLWVPAMRGALSRTFRLRS